MLYINIVKKIAEKKNGFFEYITISSGNFTTVLEIDKYINYVNFSVNRIRKYLFLSETAKRVYLTLESKRS